MNVDVANRRLTGRQPVEVGVEDQRVVEGFDHEIGGGEVDLLGVATTARNDEEREQDRAEAKGDCAGGHVTDVTGPVPLPVVDISALTSSDYLADLTDRPMDDVRSMRSDCQSYENATSFLRRMVQGRLDLVGAELARRRAGAEPLELADLVASLGDVMTGDGPVDGEVSYARPPQDLAPADIEDPLSDELEAILPAARLSELPEIDEVELQKLTDDLGGLEDRVSTQRRDLHTVIDALQAEITRRYRTGEASIESLLK